MRAGNVGRVGNPPADSFGGAAVATKRNLERLRYRELMAILWRQDDRGKEYLQSGRDIMKRRLLSIVVLMIVALSVVACGGRATETFTEESSVGGAVPEMPAMEPMADSVAMEAELAAAGEFDSSGQTASQLPVGQERLIIRTADMSIIAADTEATLAQIAALADSSGGWVVSSNVYQSTDTAKTGYVQIRVPADGFQSILDAIGGMAVEVTNLSTSGQDVTEEYVDLSARLGNLEATAARLRTFLDEARNVEEALSVSNELSRVEGEIEALKGRMQYLEQSAAYSSIAVNVTPDELAAGCRQRGHLVHPLRAAHPAGHRYPVRAAHLAHSPAAAAGADHGDDDHDNGRTAGDGRVVD